jgi:two-component system response regulator VicR
MTQARILLADDDEMIVDALRFQLEDEGFTVLVAQDGQAALDLARQAQPDLILLDVMMPKLQGWEVCREVRRTSLVPILMLTARGAELDKVLGLELGADDYIVKPFSFRELLARVRAQLRRASYSQRPAEAADNRVRLGDLVIDRHRHVVTRRGEPVTLSPREFSLLLALLDAAGAACRRDDLLDVV